MPLQNTVPSASAQGIERSWALCTARDQHWETGLSAAAAGTDRAAQHCQAVGTFRSWSWNKETIVWTAKPYYKLFFKDTQQDMPFQHQKNRSTLTKGWTEKNPPLKSLLPGKNSTHWVELSTGQASDPEAHPHGPRVKNQQSFVSVSSFTVELLNDTCWEEKILWSALVSASSCLRSPLGLSMRRQSLSKYLETLRVYLWSKDKAYTNGLQLY